MEKKKSRLHAERIPVLTHEEPEAMAPEKESASSTSSSDKKPHLPDGPAGYKVYLSPQYVAVDPQNGHKMYSEDGEEWFDGTTYFSR